MLKKYRFGFDIGGLLLFLIIMIPNFIWFAVPAPNDILRNHSITETIDAVASVFQVIMIICLCILKNRNQSQIHITPLIIITIISVAVYFISWVFYYGGITNAFVILGLTIPPCMAFLFYSIDRKNVVAVVPTIIFTICHLIYGIVNYII